MVGAWLRPRTGGNCLRSLGGYTLMALTPDTRLGPYEIAAKIGEGGIGEVYQATGLTHIEELLDEEVTALAGERYARKAPSVGGRHHGSNWHCQVDENSVESPPRYRDLV